MDVTYDPRVVALAARQLAEHAARTTTVAGGAVIEAASALLALVHHDLLSRPSISGSRPTLTIVGAAIFKVQ